MLYTNFPKDGSSFFAVINDAVENTLQVHTSKTD